MPLVLVALAVGLCVAFGKSRIVTQVQIERVKVGMTLDEVMAILGKENHCNLGEEFGYCFWYIWTGDVCVLFKNNQVDCVENTQSPDQWELWSDRIRSKLGW